MNTRMYQEGYMNAAMKFGYIPDFDSEEDIREYSRGLHDGYKKVKEIREKNEIMTKDADINMSNHTSFSKQ